MIQKGPICSGYIIKRVLHFHTAAELFVPMQKLELLHSPLLAQKWRKVTDIQKTFPSLFLYWWHIYAANSSPHLHPHPAPFSYGLCVPLIKRHHKTWEWFFQWKEERNPIKYIHLILNSIKLFRKPEGVINSIKIWWLLKQIFFRALNISWNLKWFNLHLIL